MIVNQIGKLLSEQNGNISSLAVSIRVSYKTAAALVTGRATTIRLDTLNSLCHYFGVHTSDILRFEDNDNDGNNNDESNADGAAGTSNGKV